MLDFFRNWLNRYFSDPQIIILGFLIVSGSLFILIRFPSGALANTPQRFRIGSLHLICSIPAGFIDRIPPFIVETNRSTAA